VRSSSGRGRVGVEVARRVCGWAGVVGGILAVILGLDTWRGDRVEMWVKYTATVVCLGRWGESRWGTRLC
jgi:hypothetical protein